jgi:hypothetical protein
MPVKQTTTYLSKDEDCQLTISSNFLEESVILTLSSPVQDWRPIYLELPAEDLETLVATKDPAQIPMLQGSIDATLPVSSSWLAIDYDSATSGNISPSTMNIIVMLA